MTCFRSSEEDIRINRDHYEVLTQLLYLITKTDIDTLDGLYIFVL